MQYYSTKQAAELVGISLAKLQRAAWTETINKPLRSPKGDFLWTDKDLEHVSWVLLKKPYRGSGNGK